MYIVESSTKTFFPNYEGTTKRQNLCLYNSNNKWNLPFTRDYRSDLYVKSFRLDEARIYNEHA